MSAPLFSLFATFIHRIIKCESNRVTFVWLQSTFEPDCVVFPQSISVSGTQIRPQRWWNVPADHCVDHAEGAWQWRPDQQLQFTGFYHWWQQGAGTMCCAASCYPSVERESIFQKAFSTVYWLVQIKHFSVFLGLRLCFSMSVDRQPCRHHRGECLTFPYDWTKNR